MPRRRGRRKPKASATHARFPDEIMIGNSLKGVRDEYNRQNKNFSEALVCGKLSKSQKHAYIRKLKVLAEKFIKLSMEIDLSDVSDDGYKNSHLRFLYFIRGHLRFFDRVLKNDEDIQDLTGNEFDTQVELFKFDCIAEFKGAQALYRDEEFNKIIEDLFFATRSHLQIIARDNTALQRAASFTTYAQYQLLNFIAGYFGSDEFCSFGQLDGFFVFTMMNYVFDVLYIGSRKFDEPFIPATLCGLHFKELVEKLGAANAVNYLKKTVPEYVKEVYNLNCMNSPLKCLMTAIMTHLCGLSDKTGIASRIFDHLLRFAVRPSLLSHVVASDVTQPKHPAIHPLSITFDDLKIDKPSDLGKTDYVQSCLNGSMKP